MTGTLLKCENCNETERINDNIMCMKSTCPIVVVDNGKPNHNYCWCKKEDNPNISCGEMAYQKEVVK